MGPSCIFSRDNFNSFEAPTKFVPWSQRIHEIGPRIEINRRRARMNESEERSVHTSICMALEYKHVKTHPYRFTIERRILIWKGPKKSHPTFSKGVDLEIRSIGRSDIFWEHCFARRRWQPTHLKIKDLTRKTPQIIKNPDWRTWFNVKPFPPWPVSKWE